MGGEEGSWEAGVYRDVGGWQGECVCVLERLL